MRKFGNNLPKAQHQLEEKSEEGNTNQISNCYGIPSPPHTTDEPEKFAEDRVLEEVGVDEVDVVLISAKRFCHY